MTSVDQSPTGSLATASAEEAIAYYKSQYEQLEHELAEFQTSSRELETELEKDVEASERRERKLQEKVEGLGFEVGEWKTKYKQSKAEANTVQNSLQKEITTLRDQHRSLQLRLRDIEVANDDIERQARHTTSSLEDLESKYNVSIERSVMLEAEIQVGEQEREALRIEAQRLRDELSDLRIEAEITQEKLRRLESVAESRQRPPQTLPAAVTPVGPQFAQTDTSPASTVSSPTRTTPPPPKSTSTSVSETPTPPSPPASEASVTATPTSMKLPTPKAKPRVASAELPRGSRSSRSSLRFQRPSRLAATNPRSSLAQRPSMVSPKTAAAAVVSPSSSAHHHHHHHHHPPSTAPSRSGLPPSSSLRQIRGLIGQVQRLEQRVHSARSRLPGPTPSASSRTSSPRGEAPVAARDMPSSITMRSHKKRSGVSNITRETFERDQETTPLPARRISRISSGIPAAYGTPRAETTGRPASRADMASVGSIPYTPHATSATHGHGHGHQSMFSRPGSRASMSGARTPLGHHYTTSTSLAESRRSRSSMAGHYSSLHGHSMSVSGIDESVLGLGSPTPSASRRNTFVPHEGASGGSVASSVASSTAGGGTAQTAIPTPSSSSIARLSSSTTPTPATVSKAGRGSIRLSQPGSSSAIGMGMTGATPTAKAERDRLMGPPHERRRPTIKAVGDGR